MLIVSFVSVGIAGSADAMPIGPQIFCDTYPNSPLCAGSNVPCTTCHTNPPEWNDFGAAIGINLLPGVPRPITEQQYRDALPGVLAAIEQEDADGDGYTNLVEIQLGSMPGDADSNPANLNCPPAGTNPRYDVCNYDPDYVFRKLHLDFCGQSPSYEQVKAFASLDIAAKMAGLSDALNTCLDSEWWIGKNGALWQLAHYKIRPVGSLKYGEDEGTLPVSDYYDDYALFIYTQIDGHDARHVLTADYFVARFTGPTRYELVQDQPTQRMQIDRRVGLMSTQWNLIYNVMFTALPRTAAAQAYRAFLDFDIAKQQGLFPVDNEPVDYDNKGVTNPVCAVCHSTLDPLSYPFKNYSGLQNPAYMYNPTRIEDYFLSEGPNMGNMPEAGYVLGQPVDDLVQWAKVAADSDEFARATVADYWRMLMGKPATALDLEFTDLWKALKSDHNYSVEAMLHDFIKTEAYGAP